MDNKEEVLEAVLKEAVDLVTKQSSLSVSFFYYSENYFLFFWVFLLEFCVFSDFPFWVFWVSGRLVMNMNSICCFLLLVFVCVCL
jgi:hypothetical protein